MGKRNDERRRQTFKKLEEDGRLEKPLYQRKSRAKPKATTTAPKKKEEHPCCLIKYGGEMPMGFYKCHGCPLDNEPDPATLVAP